ncbi:MAG: ATP-dependent zinc metalloprotease FtsH [Pirellulales bacterium]|nr:ATP-dependent zinc metalloprotease FtsH [Pirellulales bacterium]
MPPVPPPDKEKKPEPAPPYWAQWRLLLPYILLGFMILWLWQDFFLAPKIQTIPYSEFKRYLAAGQVEECTIREDRIEGKIDPRRKLRTAQRPAAEAASPAVPPAVPAASATPVAPAPTPAPQKTAAPAQEKPAAGKTEAAKTEPFFFYTVPVNDDKLIEELQAQGVDYKGVRPSPLPSLIVFWVLPIILLVGLWLFVSRRIGAAGQAMMSFGKSRARLVADKDTGVNFADVAGCDEAKYELQEVVDFLKNPKRYEALGAKIPKGVLLVGPPGTGKTLLARAVAGEAKVAFYSISGSDFVEMFVGVGASRVRDLFVQAKATAPCIIFIDELDAIGRQRGVHVGAVNDEREQTLNQLLVEMDGFAANVGIIILAATNRPDVLDRALLRPGRFDRQVVVDAPDIDGREAILKVHSRDKPLAPDVNLKQIAQGTPGFSGADLANALNEAALLAARRGANEIHQLDIEEAIEKVVAGPERKSRRLDADERRRVAYHEVGHALVAAHSQHADPVHKISIVPRGRAALGYTLQLPEGQQFLMTRSELVDRIRGMLGGRAAEEIVFAEVSTGAENDLERATALARQMVCAFGMSERVGLVHCGHRTNPFVGPLDDGALERDFSERTAEQVDDEVKQILDDAYAKAKQILTDHRDQLERVSQELMRRETLDAQAFKDLLAGTGGGEAHLNDKDVGLPAATAAAAQS